MSKHTRGPWNVSNSLDTIFFQKGDYHACICLVSPTNIGKPFWIRNMDEVKANAKLIAAAPDMLEALRPLADPDFLEALRHDITSLSKAQEDAIIAAFKKATND